MAVALASAERVFEMLDEPSTEVDRPGEGEARFEREIVFDRVAFRYGDGDPVLSDVSFTLAQGQGGGAGRALRGGEDDARRPAAPVPRSDRRVGSCSTACRSPGSPAARSAR